MATIICCLFGWIRRWAEPHRLAAIILQHYEGQAQVDRSVAKDSRSRAGRTELATGRFCAGRSRRSKRAATAGSGRPTSSHGESRAGSKSSSAKRGNRSCRCDRHARGARDVLQPRTRISHFVKYPAPDSGDKGVRATVKSATKAGRVIMNKRQAIAESRVSLWLLGILVWMLAVLVFSE